MGEDPAGLPLNLICFDEIDALCRRRGSLSGDTSGVRDSVVNQARLRLHLSTSQQLLLFFFVFYGRRGAEIVRVSVHSCELVQGS